MPVLRAVRSRVNGFPRWSRSTPPDTPTWQAVAVDFLREIAIRERWISWWASEATWRQCAAGENDFGH